MSMIKEMINAASNAATGLMKEMLKFPGAAEEFKNSMAGIKLAYKEQMMLNLKPQEPTALRRFGNGSGR